MVTFPDKNRVVAAIRTAEEGTGGEIRVHVARGCRSGALEEAKKVFKRLGMHRTRERNGVLIYIALKNHEFAIVGDEGIHAKVGADFWESVRDAMEVHFKNGDATAGIEAGVLRAGLRLKEHFPRGTQDKNELTDEVSEER
jgi:uncharacterized membrane protein